MADILPVEEERLVWWAREYIPKLRNVASTFGLGDADVSSAERDGSVLTGLADQLHQARVSGTDPDIVRELVNYKDMMKDGPSMALRSAYPNLLVGAVNRIAPGILPRITGLAQRIMGNSAFTSDIAKSLGLGGTAANIADRIPTGDNELGGWLRNFADKIGPLASALGISHNDVSSVQADSEAFTHLNHVADSALDEGKQAPAYSELLKYRDFMKNGLSSKVTKLFPALLALAPVAPGIAPRLRSLFERITGSPLYNERIGRELGLLPAAATTTTTTTQAATPLPDWQQQAEPRVERREEPVEPVRRRPVVVEEPHRGVSPWAWLVPAAAALGLFTLLARRPAPEPTPAPVATATSAVMPMASPSPNMAAMVAERKPGDALILSERTLQQWMEPAAAAFNASHAANAAMNGKVVVESLGSREGRDNILYDKDQIQPTAWNPADQYWVSKIQRDAANPNLTGKSGATVDQGTPLVKTYLVLLVPEDRAAAFEAAMNSPAYQGKTWTLLRDLAATGWSKIGGDESWGKLRLVQTDPTTSNSGMVALQLMYNEFARANPGKGVNDPAFLKMMGDIEGAASSFPDTTANVLDTLRADAGQGDIAVTYENEALNAIGQGLTGYKIIYPSPTAEIEMPLALVDATWVTPEEKTLASSFRDYLKSDEVQAKALDLGLRPTSPTLADRVRAYFTDATRAADGVVAAPNTAGSTLDSKLKEGLIYNWNQWHQSH